MDYKQIRRYYLTDHLGSTRAVVDNSGNVLETFDYYPFGLPMPKRYATSGDTQERFTGKERDTEGNLNLDYFGARYYDAAIGRWHGVDPLADDYPAWTPFNYVLNNPLIGIDPDGKTVYYVDGEKVYDDGSDNGLEVHTTQEIIDELTDDGNTDWDGVRNHDASSTEIVDSEKYLDWKSDLLSSLDNFGLSGSIDNKGNVDVRSVKGELESLYLKMLASFGFGQAISKFRSFGLLFKKKGDHSQLHTDFTYSTIKSILKRIGGKTKTTPRGEIIVLQKRGITIQIRNFSNQGKKTFEILKNGKIIQKIRLAN